MVWERKKTEAPAERQQEEADVWAQQAIAPLILKGFLDQGSRHQRHGVDVERHLERR